MTRRALGAYYTLFVWTRDIPYVPRVPVVRWVAP